MPIRTPQRAIDHILIGDRLKGSGTQAMAAEFPTIWRCRRN